LGSDNFGEIGKALYREENVGTTFLVESAERNTGVGFIVLNSAGDNFIILDPGANELFSTGDVDRAAERIQSSNVLITQLEIPLATAARALHLAHRAGVISILNPAPARPVPAEILKDIDIITPNETELRILLGHPPDAGLDSMTLCRELIKMGVRRIVLTRGAHGATIVTADGYHNMPAFEVEVVDTTGAGDAFNGTLAAYLARNMPLEPAVRHAVAAGALACTRLGVIPSLPRLQELEQLLSGAANLL
jgi:ribokinase